MGSFSVWHWLIVLIVIGVPAILVGAIWWFVASRERAQKQIKRQ